jgi:ABC-2 type transport system permease protein
MSAVAYTRYELLRATRNTRFYIFSLAFPLVIYFMIAVPNRDVHDFGGTGVSLPLYYMIGLLSFGTMIAVLASGARIAAERTAGWTRQLRMTPLSTPAYFRAKVLTGYALALVSLVLLYAAGMSLGVRLPAVEWLEMTGLVLVALLPVAALGILLGHLLTAESSGPAIGGTTSLFAFLGGAWFPIGSHGVFHDIAQALPSYWLVQASHVSLGGGAWGPKGWLVVAVWSLVLTGLAARAYQRDTKHV